MKNLQTGTTCLSKTTGSKQRKRERSLQRLATFVILFLCSMTVSWAQGTTTADKTLKFTQTSKTDLVHKSDEESITATFSGSGLGLQATYVKFNRNRTDGTLTITANAATISNVSLLVSNDKDNAPTTGIDATHGTTEITVDDCKMPVEWSTDNKKVVFKCSTTKDLYVFGATITYKNDDADKLVLNEVSAPTITLNSTETTTSLLSFTIDQTAKTQTGTRLETYYTTDGSNPNDAENASRVQLTQNSQTVTINWAKGNTVTVRTFTKRVDESDAKNYCESAEASQPFSNTGSTELASVDAPVITPGGEAVVATSLDVTISDKQWTSTLASKLKVYYTIDNGSYGNETEGKFQEATELPLKLTLKSTSTVRAYAEYTNSNNEVTKSDVVSRTYFLLKNETTYLNTSTSQNVGATVPKNGMTMTYGGIKVGNANFKALSKNDKTDANTLGSIHTVAGNALFVNVDVESELGDGNIGKNSIDGAEYLHCKASTKELHENTFALPAMGSFFKFEPEANGNLTVFVEQQGAIHNVGGKLYPEKVRKRPVYFLDETGKSIPAKYAYTSSKINKADWTKIQNTANASNDNFYSKEYMDKLQAYYQNIIDGNNQDFTNFNSAVADADKHKKLTLGTSIQPIIVLHEKCNADILKGDGMSETGDENYDNTGYMLISEGYVTYEFPVEAGKTYYLFASRTKLALSGFCFDIDANYKTENLQNVTLEGDKDNATTIEGLTVGNQYNVTLNRTFGSDRWYSVVLPFSVSQKQMKDVFGDGVKVLHYSDVEGTDLNLFEHFYQMIVGGTPVLVKPSQEVTNPVFNNVTLTSKEVVDIVNSGYKCTGSWNDVDFPEYSYFIDAKTNSFYLYDPKKVTTGTKPHAGAFRSWIIASGDPSTAKQLTMHINGIEEQGETTAIWNAISGNDDAEVASKGIYSLSGQKMNATDTRSLPKGIYIVNGKKFIVK